MTLTLTGVARNPDFIRYSIDTAAFGALTLRPLARDDTAQLAQFLAGLSAETLRFAPFFGSSADAAQSMCDAIARYDKLRLVVETGARIIGLLEFSMDIPESDVERYARHGLQLDSKTDCRYGPSLADDVQGRGMGGLLFPYIAEIARRFEQRRIILWGGVHANNPRAIRHYLKCGFRPVGEFVNGDGSACIDMIVEL